MQQARFFEAHAAKQLIESECGHLTCEVRQHLYNNFPPEKLAERREWFMERNRENRKTVGRDKWDEKISNARERLKQLLVDSIL